MKHQKIIKRDNGTQFEITVELSVGSLFDSKPVWTTDVKQREKGKRKWSSLPDTLNDYEFRQLSMPERRIHRVKNYHRFVTPQEILEAKMELWTQIMPK